MKQESRNKLQECRKAAGKSQTELAARAGVGVSVLNRVERWHFPVSEGWANRVADVLGRDVSDVFPYLKTEQGVRR